MNSKSNERELLSNIKAVRDYLKSKTSKSSGFSSVINQLNHMAEKIENEKVEIALVGITSSGKSTLMNVLLGEDLLPVKVRPSSSIQVVCQYGEKTCAEVYFDNKNHPERHYQNIRKVLESFGDETGNQNNIKGVKEIRLFSSKYKLKHQIVLVDTPGLDAYGQDNHEYITLKLVVPAVHMVLFLTSIKAYSDNKNLEMIDKITSDDKPLLIVQNMIDAIEPKEAKNGILKTKDEVREEHRNRVFALLNKTSKKSVKKAKMVQVSAKTGENIDTLIHEIDNQVSAISPKRLSIIQDQFFNELNELEKKLNEEKTGNHQNKERIKQYQQKRDKIEQFYEEFRKSCNDIAQTIDKQVDTGIQIVQKIVRHYGSDPHIQIDSSEKLINAIDSVKDPEHFDQGMKHDIESLAQQMNNGSERFKKYLDQSYQHLEQLCNEMNEQLQSIIKRNSIETHRVRIKMEKRTETRTKTVSVKKDGILNGVVRFFTFGICGYESVERDYEIEVFSLKESLKKAINELNKWKNSMKSSLDNYKTQYNNSFAYFLNRIDDMIKSEESKIKLNTKEIDEILNRIKKTERISIFIPIVTDKSSETNQDEVLIEHDMNDLGSQIYFLANSIRYLRLSEYRNYILRQLQKPCDIVVWGWDELYINRFMDCYFSDISNNNIEKGNSKKRLIHGEQSIHIVNEQYLNSNSNLYFSQNMCLFIVINAIQPGHSLKILSQSRFRDYYQYPYVFVFDSLSEHLSEQVNEDKIMEAFKECLKIPGILNLQKPLSYMASHTDLYYSVLLHLIFKNKDCKFDNATEKTRLLKEMAEWIEMTQDKNHKTVQYLDKFRMKE
ncbi:MAG: dynamin family protein [Candidatus Cloacimonetes bacterium]|nr:dynamin family protein [Candidatus Cloacimonadota bacterium]